jgi:hypothetical protein
MNFQDHIWIKRNADSITNSSHLLMYTNRPILHRCDAPMMSAPHPVASTKQEVCYMILFCCITHFTFSHEPFTGVSQYAPLQPVLCETQRCHNAACVCRRLVTLDGRSAPTTPLCALPHAWPARSYSLFHVVGQPGLAAWWHRVGVQ